jgi:hypothetical protein
LPSAIGGLAELAELLLKLGKQERFDLAKVRAVTSLGYLLGALLIDTSTYFHEKAYRTAELASTGLQVRFASCGQTLCNSSGFISCDHIPLVGMRFA